MIVFTGEERDIYMKQVKERRDDQTASDEEREDEQDLRQINIGLLGLGTVGTGVFRLIEQHQDDLQKQTGCKISVQKILIQNVAKERHIHVDEHLLTTDPNELIKDPDIDVIVEVMGGISNTKTYIAQALNEKKHVVTANKDLIALHGGELLTLASENECDLFYEASVAGGIPILRALVEGFSSDRVTKIIGILNGTTNYMLSKMSKDGLEYEDCLKQAQNLGYAEADPTSDVEGLDAARKIAILGTLGFHTELSLEEVDVRGISSVSKKDIDYGKEFGYELKLLATADRKNNEIELEVQPTFIPKTHPLAHVNDAFNAVFVQGEAMGETMFYGPGAGELPTATAVTSDLVTVVKNIKLGVNGRGTVAPYRLKKFKRKDNRYHRYFIRLIVEDEPGVLAVITQSLAQQNISVSKMVQKHYKEQQAEIVIITHEAAQQSFENWEKEMNLYSEKIEFASYYAVEGDDSR